MADLESEHFLEGDKNRPEADPVARDSDSFLAGNVEIVATALGNVLTPPHTQSFGPDTEAAQQPQAHREQETEGQTRGTGGLFGFEAFSGRQVNASRRSNKTASQSQRA